MSMNRKTETTAQAPALRLFMPNCLVQELAASASALLAILFLNSDSCALAQTGANAYFNPPASLSGKTIVIPTGTTFEGRLMNTIGSSVSRTGERFAIELTSPALANGTDVLIPASAQILGEVVEAVPANKVPHQKGEKPIGKLRVQITSLKMPDGTVFPLVGSLIGEDDVRKTGHNPDLGGGMAYAGSPNSFEAVAPSRANRMRGRAGAPNVVTKQQLLSDPIYGKPNTSRYGQFTIRSLVKKKRNLFIDQGSPLTVRLDAAFKMGIGIARNADASLEAPRNADSYPGTGRRRFSPQSDQSTHEVNPGYGTFGNRSPYSSSPAAIDPKAEITPANTPTGLPFLPPARNASPQTNSQDGNF